MLNLCRHMNKNGNFLLKLTQKQNTSLVNQLPQGTTVSIRSFQNKNFRMRHQRQIRADYLTPVPIYSKPEPREVLKKQFEPDPAYPAHGLHDAGEIVTTKPLSYNLGGSATITLNAHQTANTLSLPVLDQLNGLIQKYGAREGQSFGNFIKSSTSIFSSGSDIRSIYENPSIAEKFIFDELQMNYSLLTSPVPFISFVTGLANAGGAGLAFNCALPLISSTAIYQSPEVGMGYVPASLMWTLSRLPKFMGRFLALTQYPLIGTDLIHSKLASLYVESPNYELFQSGFGMDAKSLDPYDIADALADYVDTVETPFSLERQLEGIEYCFSQRTLPEILHALDTYDKAPGFFLADMADRIRSASPLAVLTTFKLLQQVETSPLQRAFEVSHRVAFRMTQTQDFKEGIKARLFENRQPVWKHKSIEEVTPEEILNLFVPLDKTPEFTITAISYSDNHEFKEAWNQKRDQLEYATDITSWELRLNHAPIYNAATKNQTEEVAVEESQEQPEQEQEESHQSRKFNRRSRPGDKQAGNFL